MSIAFTTARDPRPVLLPVPVAFPTRPREGLNQGSVWRRVSFWPLECLRLVAVVYAFPLAILAIGIPLGLALTGLIFGATWVWRLLW